MRLQDEAESEKDRGWSEKAKDGVERRPTPPLPPKRIARQGKAEEKIVAVPILFFSIEMMKSISLVALGWVSAERARAPVKAKSWIYLRSLASFKTPTISLNSLSMRLRASA